MHYHVYSHINYHVYSHMHYHVYSHMHYHVYFHMHYHARSIIIGAQRHCVPRHLISNPDMPGTFGWWTSHTFTLDMIWRSKADSCKMCLCPLCIMCLYPISLRQHNEECQLSLCYTAVWYLTLFVSLTYSRNALTQGRSCTLQALKSIQRHYNNSVHFSGIEDILGILVKA